MGIADHLTEADAFEVNSSSDTDGCDNPRFTVFTPTYERRGILSRPFESLCQQSHDSFEWIVVDDNSTDGTADQIEEFAQEATFPIRFYQQDPERPGKHRAFEIAVEAARGAFFFPLDADDQLRPNALETLEQHWSKIPPDSRDRYAGVTGLCVDQHNELIGDQFPDSPFDSDILANRYQHDISGEKAGFVRTELLRDYRFPDIEERFVPESIVWDQIATMYQTRYVNEAIRVYWQDESADSDQLTALDPSTIAQGHALFHRKRLDTQLAYFFNDPSEFIRSGIHYGRFSRHDGVGILTQIKQLEGTGGRLLCLATAAPAVALYVRDILQHR